MTYRGDRRPTRRLGRKNTRLFIDVLTRFLPNDFTLAARAPAFECRMHFDAAVLTAQLRARDVLIWYPDIAMHKSRDVWRLPIFFASKTKIIFDDVALCGFLFGEDVQ